MDLADLNGTTNHFRRQFLGTESGKARLDTSANTSCGEPTSAPALVAWVLNDFGGGLSGRMLRSTGRQPSTIHIPSGPEPEDSGATVDRAADTGDASVKTLGPVPSR